MAAVRVKAWLGALAGLALGAPLAAQASEGGASIYIQGTYGDFAAGMSGPSGVYLRNDALYYDASVSAQPFRGAVDLGVKQKLAVDLVKLAYVTDAKVGGATFNVGLVVPVILDIDVSVAAATAGGRVARSGDVNGIGDIIIAPGLSWSSGDHHFNASVGVTIPTGSYAEGAALNISRNYWAMDPTLAWTWLDGEKGREVSASAGFLINRENKATDYKTGTEFHLDVLAAQYLSETFALGLTGYWYEQISDDEGDIPATLGGFRGRGVGIGPAAMKTVKIGERDVTLVAKWLHDIESKNRLGGELVMVAFATKF